MKELMNIINFIIDFARNETACFINLDQFIAISGICLTGIIAIIVVVFTMKDEKIRRFMNIILVILMAATAFFIGMFVQKGIVVNHINDFIDEYVEDYVEDYAEEDIQVASPQNTPDFSDEPTVSQTVAPTSEPTPIYQAEIVDPIDGESIPQESVVTGTVEGEIPSDEYLWLFMSPKKKADAWWPLGEISPKNESWQVNASIGNKDNIGDEYDICVISVSEDINGLLEDNSKKTTESSAMSMPESAAILDKVTVERE